MSTHKHLLTIVLLCMIMPTLEAAPTLTFDYGADDKPIPGVKVTQTESDGTVTVYASNAAGQVTLTTTTNTYTLAASLAETGTDPISVQDALYILQHIVELRTLETDQIKAADINGDGNITIQDALKVLQHNVELITLEPSLSFYDANTGNALSATTFSSGDTPSITVIRQGDANLSFEPSSIIIEVKFKKDGDTFTFNTKNATRYDFALPERIMPVDFNNDGIDDLLMMPTGFWQGEDIPIRAFIFENDQYIEKTSSLFTETIVTGVNFHGLVHDFNGDGWNDVIIPDSGKEGGNDSNIPSSEIDYQYFKKIYILSNGDGTYSLANEKIEHNIAMFNHNAGIGDINGDNHPDLFFAILHGNEGSSETLDLLFTQAAVYFNDGVGNFSVPDPLGSLIPFRTEEYYFMPGGGSIIDLDNDGLGELLMHGGGSKNNDLKHPQSHAEDQYIKIFSYDTSNGFIPFASIPINENIKNSCGAFLGTRIIPIDLNNDNLKDFAAGWEWIGEETCDHDVYWQFMLNKGGGIFEDVSNTTTIRPNFLDSTDRAVYFHANDINGDGFEDILNASNGGKVEVFEDDLILSRFDSETFIPVKILVDENKLLSEYIADSEIGSSGSLPNQMEYWPVWLNLNKDEKLDLMIFKYMDWEKGQTPEDIGVDYYALRFIAE